MTLCTPLIIYIVLVAVCLLNLLSKKKANFTDVLVKILIVFIWGYLMQYMCDEGSGGWAWVLLLIPIVFYMFRESNKTKSKETTD